MDSVPTGSTATNYTLSFGQTTLKNPFFHNEFADYQMTSDTWQVHVTDNFYLPIWFTKQNYQEIKKVKKTHSEKEIRQIATKDLENYLKDLEEKGIQIIGKNVIIKRKSGNYVASGTIDACESIVSYQPTEIIDMTGEERQNTDESD